MSGCCGGEDTAVPKGFVLPFLYSIGAKDLKYYHGIGHKREIQ